MRKKIKHVFVSGPVSKTMFVGKIIYLLAKAMENDYLFLDCRLILPNVTLCDNDTKN
jgi:hypothetical protein